MLDGMPTGPMCGCVQRFVLKYTDDPNRSHHHAAADSVLAIIGAGRRGCPGAVYAIDNLAPQFVQDISNRANVGEAALEFRRLVEGALKIVAGDPQGDEDGDEEFGVGGSDEACRASDEEEDARGSLLWPP